MQPELNIMDVKVSRKKRAIAAIAIRKSSVPRR